MAPGGESGSRTVFPPDNGRRAQPGTVGTGHFPLPSKRECGWGTESAATRSAFSGMSLPYFRAVSVVILWPRTCPDWRGGAVNAAEEDAA
jgi:hypothetical protein